MVCKMVPIETFSQLIDYFNVEMVEFASVIPGPSIGDTSRIMSTDLLRRVKVQSEVDNESNLTC